MKPSIGVNGATRLFRFFQQTPEVAQFEQPLAEARLAPVEVSAQRQLAPLHLATTEFPGVYHYRDDAGRAGWLRTENFYQFEVRSLQQLIVVEELSDAIGIPEPWMQERPLFTGGQPRTGNPYLLIGSGVVVLGVAVWGIASVIADVLRGGGMLGGAWIAALVVLVLLVPLSVVVAIRGVLRLRWWRAARAEARRRGIDLPDKLTGVGV